MARVFTSGTNYLQMSRKWADLEAFKHGTYLTIHAWVKLNALADNKTILAQFGGGGNGSFLMRTSGASPNTKLGVFYGGFDEVGREAITSGLFTAGVWTPVAAVWNANTGTMTAYINGGNTGTASGFRHADIQSVWSIGARQGAGSPFDGDIGHVSMWPGVMLTAEQIAALAKGTPPHAVEPRNLFHWRLDGNGTEYEAGAVLLGGKAWGAVGTGGAKASSQPPVGPTRGGQLRFTTDIEDDLSSTANLTVDSGSWAINSGVLRCSGAGGGGRIRHNTSTTDSWLKRVEVEMRISSTSIADLSRGGLLTWWDGAGNGDPHARLMWRTGSAERAEIELDGVAGVAGVDFAFNLDQWYRLLLQGANTVHDFYVDDAFQCGGIASGTLGNKVGMLALSGIVDFRNFRSRSATPN